MKILLVEDNASDARLISLALQESGTSHDIRVASDGEAGLEQLRQDKPNLILLDLNLPRKTGLEFLQEMKQDADLRSIPVIVLTNSGSKTDVAQAYQNFCNAYVRKAVGYDELVRSLEALQKFWFDVVTLAD
jgi:CheY-like chemotaxis protein